MKKLLLGLFVSMAISGAAIAAPSSFLELGLINGGENGQNGSGDEKGAEISGSWAINENWYVGGTVGSYDRDDQDNGADLTNDYVNVNGGYSMAVSDDADVFVELGLWAGEQDNDDIPTADNPSGDDTDPTAAELKVGASTAISEKFSIFGTISMAYGDLDTENNDDLDDFIWSAGGAYAFTDNFSLNVKVVEGSNGVNGQDDIVRVGGRWTF